MRKGLLLSLLLGAAGLAILILGVRRDRPAEAAPKYIRVVPGIAADSAPRRAPAPTPTPQFDTDRWVKVVIRIRALELAATPSGTKPVIIYAEAEGPLPGVLDPPTTVTGTYRVAPEGSDAVGCTWTRNDVKTDFKMTVYNNQDPNLDVLLGIVAPTWFYNVTCPKVGFVTRSPKFGEEGLELFLRDLMAPYRTQEVANGVRLPTFVNSPGTTGSLPPCVKRSLHLAGSGIETSPAEIWVWVYQPDYPGGCEMEIEPLAPWDDLAPLTP